MTVLSSSVGNVGNVPMTKSVYIKAARLRAGVAAGSVVDPERIRVTPNEQGVLVTPDLQPGPAVISWDARSYHVTIPDSANPVSWWSVLALAIGVPPNTSEEMIAEALQVYLDANPIEGGGLSVEQIAAAAGNPGTPLGQTLAEHYAPLWQASTAYAINAPVVLPNGKTAIRTAAGNSRPQFDATELALWTLTGGGLDKATADGLYAPTSVATDVAALAPTIGALDLFRAVALAKKDTAPVVVACLGSSTIAGTGATTTADRFVNQLAIRTQIAFPLASGVASPATRTLAQAVGSAPSSPGVQFVSNGISGGATSADYLTSTSVAQIKALNPALILHSIGSNDWRNGVTPATFRTNLLAWIASLDASNTTPHVHLLVQQHPRMDWSTPAYPWSAYGDVMRQIARENPSRIAFIDASSAFAVTGIPTSDPLDLLGDDNIHLRDAGHRFLAEIVNRLAGFFPLGSAPAPTVPTPAAITTSDAFTGADGSIVGRSSDATLGGTAQAWGLLTNTAPYSVVSNVLRRGSAAATQFGGLAHTSPDGSVTVKMSAFPTGGDMWLDFRRAALAASDSYRITITSAGFAALSKRISGTTTTLGVNVQLALTDSLTLDCVGSTIVMKRNGDIIGTVTDTAISAAGYAGLSVGSGVTDFGIDDFTIRAAA